MNRVANQRLYLTADRSRAVVEGDAGAATLLAAGPGDEIPAEFADVDIDARFLQGDEPDPEPAADVESDDEEPAEKQAAKPANKAVKKTANKGR